MAVQPSMSLLLVLLLFNVAVCDACRHGELGAVGGRDAMRPDVSQGSPTQRRALVRLRVRHCHQDSHPHHTAHNTQEAATDADGIEV